MWNNQARYDSVKGNCEHLSGVYVSGVPSALTRCRFRCSPKTHSCELEFQAFEAVDNSMGNTRGNTRGPQGEKQALLEALEAKKRALKEAADAAAAAAAAAESENASAGGGL